MLAALLAAFGIAVTATPAGISGAVLLLPFQVSVLGTPSPAVTPTNLLYNVIATPGAVYPVPAAAPDRRPPGPAAHRRDPARRDRRIGHPRRTDPRPEDLRSGGIRRPAPARGVAHRHQADPAGRPRPPVASHSLPGPDRAGLPGRLRRRHLRHRRRLHPGSGPDRHRPPGGRRRACRPGLDLRDLCRRGW